MRLVDIQGDSDSVNTSIGHPKGSLSHSGTLKGLKKAHREIVLYVNDLEREGLKVSSFFLNCHFGRNGTSNRMDGLFFMMEFCSDFFGPIVFGSNVKN